MDDGAIDWRAAARAEAYDMPLEQIDPVDSELFRKGTFEFYFERLRAEDPVHYSEREESGPYWSVTKYNDIMFVDTHHDLFSSEPTITYRDVEELPLPMFIARDPPRHEAHRLAVAPAMAGPNLKELEPLVRSRVGAILDSLPRGETFDWVDRVSIELTSQMLATLFDFPFEDRRLLPHWSDVATAGDLELDYQIAQIRECGAYFTKLWNERVDAPPRGDLISMLAHNKSTRHMTPEEFMGDVLLLVIGGNDTTRNSMTGGLLALNQNPAEYDKLIADPGLIPNMVSEMIRWQTPLAYMRRLATQDVELGGKRIRKGDKVLMWYVSGNRDDDVIERASEFLIDRPRARQHLSYGFGIHRCVGSRLAEMQLRILWEEILARFPKIEVVGDPVRVASSFANGYSHLPVRIPA